jgi:hypothetical protein
MSYLTGYYNWHDDTKLSGGSSSPKPKCNDGQIRSKHGTPPYARCMKTETASELRSLATIGFHTRVASADTSPRFSEKLQRVVGGHRGNYKNPRAAVARKLTAYTRTDPRTNTEIYIQPRNHARQTTGGLKADDFKLNRSGELVSVKASDAALKRYNAPGSPTRLALENGNRAYVEKLSPRAKIPAGQAGALNAGQLALLKKLQGELLSSREHSKDTSQRPKMTKIVSRVTADALREYADKRRPTSA